MSGIGNFSNTGNEYIITKVNPKRPLLNYMWNDKFVSAINHTGGGAGAYGDATSFFMGVTGKPRAQLIANGNRYFYIKDFESKKLWNPGWYPTKEPLDLYKCTHGLGYTIIEGEKDNINVRLCATVAHDEPAEIWEIELTNNDTKSRKIAVYPFMEFSLLGFVTTTGFGSWGRAYYDEDAKMIYAIHPDEERPHDWYNGFCASDYEISGFDTSKDRFIGAYGDIRLPDALAEGKLRNSIGACEPLVGVFEHIITLNPGEKKQIHFVAGIANNKETAKKVADKLLKPGYFSETLKKNRENKDKLSNLMIINTPNATINHLANYWLKQQVQLCVEVGRGPGKGFRDQLQDAWAVAAFNKTLSKDKIYETLEQIYHTGRCVRGWNPLKDREMSDGPTWVPSTVNAYIKETGDFAFLDMPVRYLDEGEDTVWEHILTTIRYSSDDVGCHGLVLAHKGDWNDSLNGMGKGGKGESVWTSIALYNSLLQTAEMARELKNDAEIEKEMLERAERIKVAINTYGWDGEWYLAGYTDDGKPVGSHENEEGSIYLNSQVWATMLGIAPDDYKEKCLKAVDKYLDTDYGPLTLYPPYTKYDPSVGRLTGFVPGIWENGAPYCHGASFKVISDFIQGRGNEGYETLLKITPDSELNPSDHSGCEPYSYTNMYNGPSNPREGETTFAWITGTAGWVYRSISQYMLGFHPEYNGVTFNPCIPSEWKQLSGKRLFRKTTYEIEIENPNGVCSGIKELYVDGIKQDSNYVPLKNVDTLKIKIILG